jgi:exopolysaccharide biosynthesis protein
MKILKLSRSWPGLITGLALLPLAGAVRAEVSATNHPFAGVITYAETRAEPPTWMFIAEVDLKNPRLRLRVAPGGPDPDGPGEWQTTLMQPTRIAERERFDLVVNGDFFRARGVTDAEGTNSRYRAAIWAKVDGPAVSAGKVWATAARPRPCLVVRKDGGVLIALRSQPQPDDVEVIAGNTMLVQDGAAVAHANKVRHPRTVVGLDRSGSKLILLVVDGRKPGRAVGMSYEELAAEMLRLGCYQALNLDGGGSSVLAIREGQAKNLRILNEPTDGRERAVANALGIVLQPPEPGRH